LSGGNSAILEKIRDSSPSDLILVSSSCLTGSIDFVQSGEAVDLDETAFVTRSTFGRQHDPGMKILAGPAR